MIVKIKARRAAAVAGVFAGVLLGGCGEGDSPTTAPVNTGPVQILANPGAEEGSTAPDAWSTDTEGPQPGNNYTFEWSTSDVYSGTRSLKIRLDTTTYLTAFAHWNQEITSGIPIGKALTLTVRVKTQLNGTGAGFMVRADGPNGVLDWATTEGQVQITGVAEWRTFSVTLDQVPNDTTNLHVYLMHYPQTTGTVYFDDIELTYE